MKNQRIGIIGLGRMGANMARRLKDCNYNVTTVYDVVAEITKEISNELNCKAAETLNDVTANTDIILTVVTNDAAMHKIFSDTNDNLLIGAEGKIFINCATLSPQIHIDTEKLANAAGAETLEACMASSIPQARQGTLYLMIGGKEEVFHSVKPMLEDMSKNLRYIGESGKAAQVKALVNMVMNINTAALAEGLGLGEALGLNLTMLQEVFSQTGANSRVLETDGEDMQNRDHECYFSCEHAAKDSGIAADIAKAKGLNLPLNDATIAQYKRIVEIGKGHLDKSGIAELTFKGRNA